MNLTLCLELVESKWRIYILSFNFEKFVDTDKSFAAKVTIRQKTGQLGFNLGAVNLFKVREYSFAILYFDAEKQVVGIQLSDEKAEGSIEIKQGNANTYIRAKNFCDKFGISYSSSHSYELKTVENNGMLYFELSSDAPDDAENGAGQEAEEVQGRDQRVIDID